MGAEIIDLTAHTQRRPLPDQANIDQAYLACRIIRCVGPLGGLRQRAASITDQLADLTSPETRAVGEKFDRWPRDDGDEADLLVGTNVVHVDARTVVGQAGRDLAGAAQSSGWDVWRPDLLDECVGLAEAIAAASELAEALVEDGSEPF